jgi:hypothetical protein
MIQTEQILEYIDGQLDPESEQALFDAMARQPELRLALRQFISISEAVRADREAYSPPAEVEQALLEGIGLPIGGLWGSAPRTGLLARFGTYGKRFLGMATSFVVGALAAGSGVYLWMESGSEQANLETARHATEATAPAIVENNAPRLGTNGSDAGSRAGAGSNSNLGDGSVPNSAGNGAGGNALSVEGNNGGSSLREGSGSTSTLALRERSSNGTDRRSTSQASSERNGRNGVNGSRSSNGDLAVGTDRVDQSGSNGNNAMLSEESSPDQALGTDRGGFGNVGTTDIPRTTTIELRASSLPLGDATSEALRAPRVAANISSSSALTPFGDVQEEDRENLMIEARGQVGQSLNQSEARASDWSSRAGYAGGVYWRFDRSAALLVEGGFESYDQTLLYPIDPQNGYGVGDTVRVDQRPSYVWGGVGLRYYLGSFLTDNLETFAQTTIGGVSAGPIARFRLGASYDLGMNFGLSVGGEFSSLLYSFRDQRMMSGRWGVTVGAEYVIR